VLSTINGDSNVPFYTEFANQGLKADDCPIIAFSVAEDELRAMDTSKLAGHLAAWNYFQSIDTPENKKFVADFKAYCKAKGLPGGDSRVTDDPIEAAYYGVYVWKMAAEAADSFDVDKVREKVYGMKFDAPGGAKQMDPKNQHTWKPVYIGEILKDGMFKIVYKSDGLVVPDSYSKLLHSDAELAAMKPTGGPKMK
jgi:urea transport system substrate-binding protein